MSPAVYVGFAILLSMFFGWLAVRVVMRSAAGRDSGRPSVAVVMLAVGSWGFLSFIALSLALSTTNTVQTSIIVTNMEGNPPFRAIAAHDQEERARLRAAVSVGLQAGRDGDIRKSVIDAVTTELRPYMNRRLSTAPDRVYLDLAAIVADALRKSQLLGRCIVPGDRNSIDLRHDLDTKRIMAWSETLIATPSRGQPSAPGQEDIARQREDLVARVVARGVDRAQAIAALTPNASDKGRCGAYATMLGMASSDPDRRRGAADARLLLTGFQLPG